MPISTLQVILAFFILFALSRVFLQFKNGGVSLIGLIFWTVLFGSAIIFTVFPILTSDIARSIGIGRGVDVIVYTSIVILFYLVFRLYVYIQDLKREITDLVNKLALKDIKK